MCTCLRFSVFECMCVCVCAGFPNALFPASLLPMWLLEPEVPEHHHLPSTTRWVHCDKGFVCEICWNSDLYLVLSFYDLD